MQSFKTNQGVFIVTPPRSGTHMLVDSISSNLKRHSVRFTRYDKDFWQHPTVLRNDSVIGIHCNNKDQNLLDFALKRKIITSERHPIGQALSILAMYKRGGFADWDSNSKYDVNKLIKCNPNSDYFVEYVMSEEFKEFRSITNQWSEHGLCVSFDKILQQDNDEYKKISDYIGVKFVPTNIDSVKNKYSDGVIFLGDPDLWRGVISQDIANDIGKAFPEYDVTTYGNSYSTGNWIFENFLKV
jgi:hypothetical protein